VRAKKQRGHTGRRQRRKNGAIYSSRLQFLHANSALEDRKLRKHVVVNLCWLRTLITPAAHYESAPGPIATTK